MKKNNSLSLAESAYEILKREIITCVLEPGEQIVQSQMAKKYNLGLTPIREALQRLAQEGFVNPIPRYGYIVSPVTIADVHQIYEARLIVEIATVRLAAERGTPEQISEIQKTADFTYTHGDRFSYTEFLNYNANFHIDLASISGNQRLVNLLSIVLEELNRVMHMGLDIKDRADNMRNTHIALADALANRDADKAELISRQEIESSRQMVLEAISEEMSSTHPTLFGKPIEIKKIK